MEVRRALKRMVGAGLAGLAAAPMASCSLGDGVPPRPNIVHILTDDLGWQDVGCYDVDGKCPYETPNLDRLARNGIRFTQAYAPSPTCSPSRAAYITGEYPPHNGVLHVIGGLLPRPMSNADTHISPYYPCRVFMKQKTLPEALSAAGYICGHVAKWHAGGHGEGYPGPLAQGFDFGWDRTETGQTYYNQLWDTKDKKKANFWGLHDKMFPDRLSDFAASYDPEDLYSLDREDDDRPFESTLDLAIRWMDTVKSDAKPFFLNYCTWQVHGPIQARNLKRFKYYCEKMKVPFPSDFGSIARPGEGQNNPYYAAMVDELDWMIGKVMLYLEQTDDPRYPGHKLIENTYVIVSSDNGGAMNFWPKNREGKDEYEQITDNSPLRLGKQTLYEGGVRIPFIVRGPGIEPGAVSKEMVSLIDLFPTFLAIAGARPPADVDLDGCNIMPVLLGKDQRVRFDNGDARDALFFHYPIEYRSACAIRKGNWKFCRNLAPGMNTAPEYELFRLYNEDGSDNDIGEEKNLADAFPEMREELLKELNAWLKKHNAAMPYKNPWYEKGDLPGQESIPLVTGRNQDEDRVWISYETGQERSRVIEAELLYTVNGGGLLTRYDDQEEWFSMPAVLSNGRAEATVPPGTTHAVFCLRDEKGFMITSEPLPTYRQYAHNKPMSTRLENAFAFRPGLWALIKCGASAVENAGKAGEPAELLKAALEQAKVVSTAEDVDTQVFSNAMRNLRKEIRALKGTVPEADIEYLNFFQLGKF